MGRFRCVLLVMLLLACGASAFAESTVAGDETPPATTAAILLYQGHASLRITTPEGKTIYIDPYAGKGYDVPADLIMITHAHSDHNKVKQIKGNTA